jgi:hypothetical protein
MWAHNQNRTSDSQSSLQSRPRPLDYTHRSVRSHIPVPARNVRTHIPVPATAVHDQISVCAIGGCARPSFPSALVFPLSPTGSAPDISYPPLRARPATRLRPLARWRGGAGGSQRGKVSQIYHGRQSTPVWPLLGGREGLSGISGGRATRPTYNPGLKFLSPWPH